MDDTISNFYVTLPSTASLHEFPNNTQSSYRTKLNTPLVLNGDWEVALSEICMPRSWFNIDEHNNTYSLKYEREEKEVQDEARYIAKATYRGIASDMIQFWNGLNAEIENHIGRGHVLFKWNESASSVQLQMESGYELLITPIESEKLLYMLHLPKKKLHQIVSETFKFRHSTAVEPLEFEIYIINKNPISVSQHLVAIMPYLGSSKTAASNPRDFFDSLNYNLMLLDIQDYVRFSYNESKNKVSIDIAPHVEVRMSPDTCPSLMKILDIKTESILKGNHTLKVKFTDDIKKDEEFNVVVSHFTTSVRTKKVIENLIIPPGIYKTAKELFDVFRVPMELQPNMHVALNVPPSTEIEFNKNLADMLGFKRTRFIAGFYFGDYSLLLDDGVTEIFVYCDAIQSVHVGDSVSPLLRIIPCQNETKPQIVKYYDRPIYVPIRKKFLETIEIELRSSTGKKITFTSGKTYVVLAFRKKTIK